MEGLLLDSTFNSVSIIDMFSSFIWVDRYIGYGDFEIARNLEVGALDPIRLDEYLVTEKSDRMMIVETIEIKTDAETGSQLIISGRSLESILERYIIWGSRRITDDFQTGIETLLNENIINPSDPDRKIPNFTFKRSTDPAITSLTMNAQFLGDNLYDAIYYQCYERNVGFRVLPKGSGGFEFELYKGLDRSYSQNDRLCVIFSPGFENLLTSNFIESKRALKTAALIGGSGKDNEKIFESVSNGAKGLERREIYVESSGISSSDDITPEEYLELLKQKGWEELSKTAQTFAFEGEIDAARQFIYGKDFHMGDVVQIVNEYGMEAVSRVSELIMKHDGAGEAFYPTFTKIESDLEVIE